MDVIFPLNSSQIEITFTRSSWPLDDLEYVLVILNYTVQRNRILRVQALNQDSFHTNHPKYPD